MKTFFYLSIFFLFFLNSLQAQNNVLIKNIEYDVPIINKDLCQGSELSETDWWKRNIETSKRWYFQQALMNKALKGEIKVYNYDGNELSHDEIFKKLTYKDTIIKTRTKPPYDKYDTVITKYISPSEIHSLRFREAWYYDTFTFKIRKEISDYSPIIAVDKEVKYQNKTKIISQDMPLFWIKNVGNTDKKNYETLTDYILYNSPIFSNLETSMPQFGNILKVSNDSISRQSYIESLLFSAISEKIKTYPSTNFSDYYTFAIDNMTAFNLSEIQDIAATCDTMEITKNTLPNKVLFDTIICKVKDIKNILLFRFYEKWSLDPKTMSLQKEVVALSPCEVMYNARKEFKGIIPMFTVLFGKAAKCFEE